VIATDPKHFASRFFNGQDELRGPLPPDLCAPTYRAEIAGFPPMDEEGHGGFGRAFYAAFPDLAHQVDEAEGTERGFVVRFTIRGTHQGPFMGLEPTGRAIEVSAIVLLTLEGERVAHLRGIFDQLGLLRQLGAIA